MALAPCSCAPALVALRRELAVIYPGREKDSDGCCGDAAHRARKSDHNPDRSGYAHAHDFDEDVIGVPGERPLWALRAHLLRDPRTKYVIYEGRVAWPDGTDRPYTGVNAHKLHLHESILDSATFDTRPWLAGFNGPPPTPPPARPAEETDMDRTAIPSWSHRTADGRWPFYRLDVPATPGSAPNPGGPPLVLAYNGAPLLAPAETGLAGAQAGSIFGVPFLRLGGLAAPALAIEEAPDGSLVVVCVDGGTITVTRPR